MNKDNAIAGILICVALIVLCVWVVYKDQQHDDSIFALQHQQAEQELTQEHDRRELVERIEVLESEYRGLNAVYLRLLDSLAREVEQQDQQDCLLFALYHKELAREQGKELLSSTNHLIQQCAETKATN